jgi:predicted MFS family arabinose efflux permease
MAAATTTDGRRGLLLSCVAIVLIYVTIFSVPPLISTFVDEVGFSHAEAGGLMAAFLLAYCVGGVPAGRLADRFGAARVMAAGVILAGVGSLLCAATEALAPLLALRAVVGFGDALTWTAGLIYVMQVLPAERRAGGVGIFTGALSCGIALAFLITPVLEDPLGWQGIMALYGAIAIVGGAFVLVAVRSERPVAVGGPTVPIGEVVRRRGLLVVSGALFIGLAVSYGPLTWLPPFMDEVSGFSDGQRGVAGLLMSAAAIPGSILGGIVAVRSGRPAQTFALFLAFCLPVGLLAFVGESSYVLVTLIAMLVSFGAIAAIVPMFASISVVVSDAEVATASGVATTIALAGGVTATYAGGLLVSYAGGYDVALLVFAGCALAGILAAPAIGRALAAANTG